MSEKPLYDVALLQTYRLFKNNRQLKICEQDPHLGTILGASGLGSITSSTKSLHSSQIEETYFYESVFESPTEYNWMSCRNDNICVEKLIEESNLCPSDVGDPLHLFICGQGPVPCLYGIASYFVPYFETKNEMSIECRDTPVFARVIPFKQWILKTISANPHPSKP